MTITCTFESMRLCFALFMFKRLVLKIQCIVPMVKQLVFEDSNGLVAILLCEKLQANDHASLCVYRPGRKFPRRLD